MDASLSWRFPWWQAAPADKALSQLYRAPGSEPLEGRSCNHMFIAMQGATYQFAFGENRIRFYLFLCSFQR